MRERYTASLERWTLRHARRVARARGITVAALIDEGLLLAVARHDEEQLRKAAVPPLPDGDAEDSLDPERILQELPERERGGFLQAYRAAAAGAQDPAGWKTLQQTLRAWRGLGIAVGRPGFYEAQELALAGTGPGMLLEDAAGLHRPGA